MKVGRNDPCPCGSGKKYKHCCYAKDSVKHETPPADEVSATEAEATNAESGGTDSGETTSAEERDRQHAPLQHNKGRARFQGDARGKATNFIPRTHRGAQRGN